jgi:hypothetical protein
MKPMSDTKPLHFKWDKPLMQEWTPETLARFFHDTYENLAPSFGYETRKDTREFNPESQNGRLMVTVCGAVLLRFNTALAAEREQKKNEHKLYQTELGRADRATDEREIAIGVAMGLKEKLLETEEQLAAERERHGIQAKGQIEENKLLSQQLAAEREKVHRCKVIHRHRETIELLKEQLAAERERILAYQAQIRGTNGKLMETRAALAAERERHREELQAEIHERDRGWSNYRESQQQLAAALKQRDDFRRALEQRVGEVDELREQLK